jgi:hypothetical protein
LRPILTPSAKQHALQLLELGLIEIEQAADGRLWMRSIPRGA